MIFLDLQTGLQQVNYESHFMKILDNSNVLLLNLSALLGKSQFN